MIRDYIVNRVDANLVELAPGVLQPQTSSTPIGRLSAASREDAERAAAAQFPDVKVAVTRVDKSKQVDYRV